MTLSTEISRYDYTAALLQIVYVACAKLGIHILHLAQVTKKQVIFL